MKSGMSVKEVNAFLTKHLGKHSDTLWDNIFKSLQAALFEELKHETIFRNQKLYGFDKFVLDVGLFKFQCTLMDLAEGVRVTNISQDSMQEGVVAAKKMLKSLVDEGVYRVDDSELSSADVEDYIRRYHPEELDDDDDDDDDDGDDDYYEDDDEEVSEGLIEYYWKDAAKYIFDSRLDGSDGGLGEALEMVGNTDQHQLVSMLVRNLILFGPDSVNVSAERKTYSIAEGKELEFDKSLPDLFAFLLPVDAEVPDEHKENILYSIDALAPNSITTVSRDWKEEIKGAPHASVPVKEDDEINLYDIKDVFTDLIKEQVNRLDADAKFKAILAMMSVSASLTPFIDRDRFGEYTFDDGTRGNFQKLIGRKLKDYRLRMSTPTCLEPMFAGWVWEDIYKDTLLNAFGYNPIKDFIKDFGDDVWESQFRRLAAKSETKVLVDKQKLPEILEERGESIMGVSEGTLRLISNDFVEMPRPEADVFGLTVIPYISTPIKVVVYKKGDELPEPEGFLGGQPYFTVTEGTSLDLRTKNDLLVITEVYCRSYSPVQTEHTSVFFKEIYASNFSDVKVIRGGRAPILTNRLVCSGKNINMASATQQYSNHVPNSQARLFDALFIKSLPPEGDSTLDSVSNAVYLQGREILHRYFHTLYKNPETEISAESKISENRYALFISDLIDDEAVKAFSRSKEEIKEYSIVLTESWSAVRPITDIHWSTDPNSPLKYVLPSGLNWKLEEDTDFFNFLYNNIDAARENIRVCPYNLIGNNPVAVVREAFISNIYNFSDPEDSAYTEMALPDVLDKTWKLETINENTLSLLGYSDAAIKKIKAGTVKRLKMGVNTNFLAAYYSYSIFMNITSRSQEYLGQLAGRLTELTSYPIQTALADIGVRGFTDLFNQRDRGLLPYILNRGPQTGTQVGELAYMHSSEYTSKRDTFRLKDDARGKALSVCYKIAYGVMETLTRPIVLLINHISTLTQDAEVKPNPFQLDNAKEQYSSKGYYRKENIREDFIESVKAVFADVRLDAESMAIHDQYSYIPLDFSSVESTQKALDRFTDAFFGKVAKELMIAAPLSLRIKYDVDSILDSIDDLESMSEEQLEYLKYHISGYLERHDDEVIFDVVKPLRKSFESIGTQRAGWAYNLYFGGLLSKVGPKVDGESSKTLVYDNKRKSLDVVDAYSRGLEAIRGYIIRTIYDFAQPRLTALFSLETSTKLSDKEQIFRDALLAKSTHINMVNLLDFLKNPTDKSKAYSALKENNIKTGKTVINAGAVDERTISYKIPNNLVEGKNPIDYHGIGVILQGLEGPIATRYPNTNVIEGRVPFIGYMSILGLIYENYSIFTDKKKSIFGPTLCSWGDLELTYITYDEKTQIQNLINLGTTYSVCFGDTSMGYRSKVAEGKADFLSVRKTSGKVLDFIYLNRGVISEGKGQGNLIPFTKKKVSGYKFDWYNTLKSGSMHEALAYLKDNYVLEQLGFFAVALVKADIASGALPISSAARKYDGENIINVYALALLDYYNITKDNEKEEVIATDNEPYLKALHGESSIRGELKAAFDELVDGMKLSEILDDISVNTSYSVSDRWKKLG